MSQAAAHTNARVRLAEVIAALSLATDLAMGQPMAAELGISAKTADNHIQNVYAKIHVSTRAGATLFAMEHALLD